jgi:hypothetical protein
VIHRTRRVFLEALLVLLASSARADQVTICPGKVVYYVFAQPGYPERAARSSTLKNYFEGYLKFPAEIAAWGLASAKDYWRTVDERSTAIVFGVCDDKILQFEHDHQIASSLPVHQDGSVCSSPHPGCSNELFALMDAKGKPIGAKWQDVEEPFTEGGGIATQSYFVCEKPHDGGPQLIVVDAAAFHSGLSHEAIGASEYAKEKFWFRPVRRALRAVTSDHVQRLVKETCGSACGCEIKSLSYRDFVERAKTTANQYRIHYDVYDPNYGDCGAPKCPDQPAR